MDENVWIPTLDESDLQEGAISLVFPKGVSIILIKKQGRFTPCETDALICHARLRVGGSTTTRYSARVTNGSSTSPAGEFLAAREIKVQTYLCKTQDGKVHVKLEGP